MIKKTLAVIAISTLSLASQTASAGGFNFGLKTGAYKFETKSDSKTSFAPMISGQIGYEFLDLTAVDVAAEFEIGKTVGNSTLKQLGKKFDVSATTIGGYLSARTLGPIYVIGRVGYAQTSFSGDAPSKKVSGPVIGAGAGFSLGVRTELELTRYALSDDKADTDYGYYLSLGGSF